eukprot:scaffold5653_cov147-Cylindrotheca_fusiformis.AAC.11
MSENQADPESIGAGPINPSGVTIPRMHRDRQAFLWSRVHLSHESIVPPPRSGAASVVVQGKLYMFGGYGGGTGRLDDFFSFDFRKNVWEEVHIVGDTKPGCRENNGVVISDSSKSIYLFGGYDGSAWLNDLWKFDIESHRWTCIQKSSVIHDSDESLNSDAMRGNVPSPRFGYVSVVHNDKLVLFGGFDGSRWLSDMYVFDFQTKQWREVAAKGKLPSPRSCPAWAKDDTHVYIQGGYDGVERKDDFFACDLSTYTWAQMPSLGVTPSPRYFHSCCLYGNKMYLYGGYSGSQRLADMFAYDFETNHWSAVDCSNGEAPSGRSSLVAQVYENSLYVFGGYDGKKVLSDFHKFRLKPIGVPPMSLVKDFGRLVNQPDMSDVTFIIEGKEVHAHRAILAVRSEYFRALLFNGLMRESVTSGVAVKPITLSDVSHAVFLKVLEYLYTDSIRDVTLELGMDLLIASEQFMLDRLKSICEDIVRREISEHNAIHILVVSHQHNATGLKEIALEFLLQNLQTKAIQSGLSDLKSEPDLLVEIIQLSTKQSFAVQTEQGSSQIHRPQRHTEMFMNGGPPFGGGDEWNAPR